MGFSLINHPYIRVSPWLWKPPHELVLSNKAVGVRSRIGTSQTLGPFNAGKHGSTSQTLRLPRHFTTKQRCESWVADSRYTTGTNWKKDWKHVRPGCNPCLFLTSEVGGQRNSIAARTIAGLVSITPELGLSFVSWAVASGCCGAQLIAPDRPIIITETLYFN